MQAENSSNQTFVEQKPFRYAGICNLCHFENHLTQDCPFALTFYHATEKDYLLSIVENGLHPNRGRLGYGVYVSDNPEMCIKYVSKEHNKFREPILLKLKVMISGEIEEIESRGDSRMISLGQMKKENIQAIKCPYFQISSGTFHEFCLIEPELVVVVSWRPITESEQMVHKLRPIDHYKNMIEQRKQFVKRLQKNVANELESEEKVQNSDENDGKKSRQVEKFQNRKKIKKMVIPCRDKANKKKNFFSRQLRRLH